MRHLTKMKIKFIPLAATLCVAGFTVSATPIPDTCLTGGFAIGCQAWTFKEFSVLEAIDKTAAAGGKVIEFFPGQKFSPDQPGVKFDHNATDEMIATVKTRLEKDGIRAVNYGVVKDRDARIGACADIGHWVQSGLQPVDCLKILQGRIISVHLHDMNEMSPTCHDVPAGTGVCNVAGVLDELKRQNFVGNISIEYEYNWKNNVVDAAQCVGFVRGHGARAE